MDMGSVYGPRVCETTKRKKKKRVLEALKRNGPLEISSSYLGLKHATSLHTS